MTDCCRRNNLICNNSICNVWLLEIYRCQGAHTTLNALQSFSPVYKIQCAECAGVTSYISSFLQIVSKFVEICVSYTLKFIHWSSYPHLIPLLCSNHHQIWDIISLSYVSILWKILKQVVNKTENNLTLKVKFCLYIHMRKILFDASNCKYKQK